MPSLVAVVVLTWNRRDDTLACLRSLAVLDHAPLLTLVVDNGSVDGTAEAVAHAFPEVELIQNGENLGFAEGNNVGLRRALELGAAYVCLLNNDTEVEPGFVTALVDEAGRRPDAGALCSKVLFFEPPGVVWYAGARFDPRQGYNGRQRGFGERDDGRFESVVQTDRACAASMLVPRAVLERVGLLDPELFAYVEDTDWSLRARAAGLSLLVVPASRVRHRVSLSSGGESSPPTLYYNLRNTLRVCERHAPLGPFGTWRRRGVVLGVHVLQALLSSRRAEGLQAVVEGWRDFRRSRFGARGTQPRARGRRPAN